MVARSKASYGVDAPGVLTGLTAAGLVGGVAALVIISLAQSVWLVWLGLAVLLGALVPFSLGLMMGLYVIVGKHRTRDLMLSMHPWRGDETVLDVGTGAGLLAIGAAHRTTRPVTAIDIWSSKDLSNNGRKAIEQNLAAEGVVGKVIVVDGDARALAFPEAQFDRVLSLLCLHNIERENDRRGACFEIARVLKPGGIAIIGDYQCVPSYARWFAKAGLRVTYQRSAFATALSLMWIVVAEKPLT